jgi:2-polyprenyl-6-methoxyphenol hydroxylase-like FAD-dependent oxidoreductase
MAEWGNRLPWIDLSKLVERSMAIVEFPMLDRDPLPTWAVGRVALLGDAAHPMFPMGMNGGSQSIIDARVLAWCLARGRDPAAALRDYDRIRRTTVNAIVLGNRDLGPEEIIARAEAYGGALPADDAEKIANRYKKLTLATVDQVNARTPWSIPSDTGNSSGDPSGGPSEEGPDGG